MVRRYVGILCIVLLLVSLGGCIQSAPPTTRPPRRGAFGSVTPTPTLSPAEQLLADAGPGWEIISQADYTGDATPEVIIARTTPMTLAEEFLDPIYADYPLIASELQVVELDEQGASTVLLHVQPNGFSSGSTQLISLMLAPEHGKTITPSAFLISDPDTVPGQLILIPLNASGERLMQSLRLSWEAETHRYHLFFSREE